jgi:hypothetical protein
VTWDVDPQFSDPEPWTFQLQVSQSGVAVDGGDDWVDVGPPSLNPPGYVLDDTQRLWGVAPTLQYRLILTTSRGSYVSLPTGVFGTLRVRDWLTIQEIVRKEQLMLKAFVGVNGFLLKAKRYGTRCSCVDLTTGEVRNSSDLNCFGTGWVGGFHPPVPLSFANLTNATADEHVDYALRGVIRDVTIKGRMVATLPVVSRDAWIAVGSDERYYVHEVTEVASFSSVPVVLDVSLRLAPRSDVIYQVPVVRPEDPLVGYRVTTVQIV